MFYNIEQIQILEVKIVLSPKTIRGPDVHMMNVLHNKYELIMQDFKVLVLGGVLSLAPSTLAQVWSIYHRSFINNIHTHKNVLWD